jgi:hypothetical protein
MDFHQGPQQLGSTTNPPTASPYPRESGSVPPTATILADSLLLYNNRLVTPLKPMINPPVPPVETLCVLPIALPPTPEKTSVHGFHQQIGVAQLIVCMHHPIKSPTDITEHLQPGAPIIVVK